MIYKHTCTYAKTYTHTHAHTYIYVYVNYCDVKSSHFLDINFEMNVSINRLNLEQRY